MILQLRVYAEKFEGRYPSIGVPSEEIHAIQEGVGEDGTLVAFVYTISHEFTVVDDARGLLRLWAESRGDLLTADDEGER